jgi:PAS domain S-box-containing protein
VTPAAEDSTFPLARRRWSTLTVCIAVCAVYSALGAAGVSLMHRIFAPELATIAPTLGLPWLPVGIGVGGLLLFGTRAWPGVFAGSCIVWGLVQGDAWGPVLIDAVGETLSIVLIARLLIARHYRPALTRYQDAIILIVAAATGRLLSSGIDMLALIAAPWLDTRSAEQALIEAAGVIRNGNGLTVSSAALAFAARWWANSVVGIVLVVPLLAFVAPSDQQRHPGTRAELWLWAAASLAWLLVALSLHGPTTRVAVLGAALALVVWAARRFGIAIASLGTLVFSICATVGFGLQLGTFAGVGGREGIEVAWGFIGLLCGVGLFLSVLLSGLERAQRQSAASAERYRRLFFANPSPMWAEEVDSGRILAVNASAVAVYGYAEQDLLALCSRDLMLGPDSAPESVPGSTVKHRTAAGRELEVEVTAVPVELEEATVRICIVDVVGERNELRLAVLNATDLERQRLGQQIRETLGPILNALGAAADEILDAVDRGQPMELQRLAAIEQEAAAATKVCRQLSRDASLIHFVSGDLIEALRRLPEDLRIGGGPAVRVSVHAFAPLRLSLERSEHIFGVARDAVRAALLRRDVRSVQLIIDVTADALEVTIEDDGVAPEPQANAAGARVSALKVRAAAARARLEIGSQPGGRNRIRVECRQTLEAVEPVSTAQPALADAGRLYSSRAAPAVAPSVPDGVRRAWARGPLLLLAYVAAGAAGLAFLQFIGARHTPFVPPLAIPWIANGIAVAGLLRWGERYAPLVFAASVALWGGIAHDPWITVIVDAFGETLCALIIVRLLALWGFHLGFDRFRDLLLLVAAAATGRAFACTVDALALHLTVALTPSALTAAMIPSYASTGQILDFTRQEFVGIVRWWANGLSGVVLVVPVAVPISGEQRRILAGRWRELVLFTLAVALAAAAVTAGPASNWRLPALLLSLVLVAWSSLRFGVTAASAATLVLSMAAAVGYGTGLGPLSRSGEAEGADALWGFIGLLAATGLFLTAVVAEYGKALDDLEALKARFEAFLEALPMPLYAFSEATGRMTLVNAAAIRKYGYARAEFLSTAPAALLAEAAPSAALGRQLGLTGHTLLSGIHRTQAGRKFEVELSVTPVNVGGQVENLCFAIDVTERNDLRRRLLEASDVERRRLAHELHDGLGQILTGLSLGITSLCRVMGRGGSPGLAGAQFVAEAIREATHTCTQILQGLSPLESMGGDLLAALRNLPLQIPPQSREKIVVDIAGNAALNVALSVREHLYQIARECVNNALKHANATRIRVIATINSALITILVEDDGVGFDPAAPHSGGVGLLSLALRSEAVHGRLAVRSVPTGGTVVTCYCPQADA